MNGPALEARLLGLVHLPGCPGSRVECYKDIRPGKPLPPARVEATNPRTGKPTGRTFERGPARPGPETPLRAARCLDCGASATREIAAAP